MALTGIDYTADIEALRKIEKGVLVYSYEDKASLEVEGVDFNSAVSSMSALRKTAKSILEKASTDLMSILFEIHLIVWQAV